MNAEVAPPVMLPACEVVQARSNASRWGVERIGFPQDEQTVWESYAKPRFERIACPVCGSEERPAQVIARQPAGAVVMCDNCGSHYLEVSDDAPRSAPPMRRRWLAECFIGPQALLQFTARAAGAGLRLATFQEPLDDEGGAEAVFGPFLQHLAGFEPVGDEPELLCLMALPAASPAAVLAPALPGMHAVIAAQTVDDWFAADIAAQSIAAMRDDGLAWQASRAGLARVVREAVGRPLMWDRAHCEGLFHTLPAAPEIPLPLDPLLEAALDNAALRGLVAPLALGYPGQAAAALLKRALHDCRSLARAAVPGAGLATIFAEAPLKASELLRLAAAATADLDEATELLDSAIHASAVAYEASPRLMGHEVGQTYLVRLDLAGMMLRRGRRGDARAMLRGILQAQWAGGPQAAVRQAAEEQLAALQPASVNAGH